VTLIWSCPTCWSDLADDDDGWNLWCAKCERLVSWREFADEDDERYEFTTEVTADGS
jgi:hypothetical protein